MLSVIATCPPTPSCSDPASITITNQATKIATECPIRICRYSPPGTSWSQYLLPRWIELRGRQSINNSWTHRQKKWGLLPRAKVLSLWQFLPIIALSTKDIRQPRNNISMPSSKNTPLLPRKSIKKQRFKRVKCIGQTLHLQWSWWFWSDNCRRARGARPSWEEECWSCRATRRSAGDWRIFLIDASSWEGETGWASAGSTSDNIISVGRYGRIEKVCALDPGSGCSPSAWTYALLNAWALVLFCPKTDLSCYAPSSRPSFCSVLISYLPSPSYPRSSHALFCPFWRIWASRSLRRATWIFLALWRCWVRFLSWGWSEIDSAERMWSGWECCSSELLAAALLLSCPCSLSPPPEAETGRPWGLFQLLSSAHAVWLPQATPRSSSIGSEWTVPWPPRCPSLHSWCPLLKILDEGSHLPAFALNPTSATRTPRWNFWYSIHLSLIWEI